MRVAVYYNNKDIRLEEMPVPQIGAGELLVKVMASGICGSDVMEWYRIKTAPRVLGHEVAGEVVGVGGGVDKYRIGDRVFVSHHVPCNTCYYCLNGHHSVCDTLRKTNFEPGGFSEYIRVPAINVDRGVFILPDEISYDEGTFIEPLACVLRGLRVSKLQPGQRVLIIGSGISGLLMVKTAKALGAGKVVATDINEYRLDAAKRFGADVVSHANTLTRDGLKEITDGWLADLVVICAGSLEAISQGLRLVERGGTVLFFAPTPPSTYLPLPLWDIWRDGITMTTTYAGSPLDIIQATELLRLKRVDARAMITHRFGLEETGKGFELVAKAEASIKVIIEPHL